MNIAQTVQSYYDSKDFKQDYQSALEERYANDKGNIIDRILELFNISNYELQKALASWKVLTREEASLVYTHVADNIESYTADYPGCWVGYTSLEAVEFGEQEEQLTEIHNRLTNKPYRLAYLQKIFSAEGYVISKDGNYAYYQSGGGLHIDLLKSAQLLDNFIKDLGTTNETPTQL